MKKKLWGDLLLMLLPLLFVLLGSVAGKYPFSADRLSLFLLPSWLIMIICGLFEITRLLIKIDKKRVYATIAVLFLMFLQPAYTNCVKVKNLRFAGGRHVNRMMTTLNDNAQNEDTVFLHWASILAFYYYFTNHEPGYVHEYPIRGREGTIQVIYGAEHTFNPEAYEPMFQKIETVPGRLWVVFGHKYPSEEMVQLESRLTQKRVLKKTWDFKGCRLLLYDPVEIKM
jgi:hypothetical protein